MRPVRAFAFVLLCALVGIPGNAKPPVPGIGAHPKADEHFVRGEFRLAARSYRAAIDRDPSDLIAVYGVARSLSALDDCEEPLALLTELRKSPAWGWEMAIVEATCRSAMGDLAGAEAAFDETLRLGGEPRGVWPRVALLRLAGGDLDGFEDAVAAYEASDGASYAMVSLLRAHEGVERGLPDADERIIEARRAIAVLPRGAADARVLALEARRWAELGDYGTATSVFVDAVKLARGDAMVAAWSIECSRRAGSVKRAQAGVDREGVRRARGALIDSVRARILVDEGAVDEAVAVLDALGDSDHPEVLATRWYVARARGDAAEQERWAARWAAVSLSARPLEDLIPL